MRHHHATPSDPERFWEEHYRDMDPEWGTRPNASLVALVEAHAPAATDAPSGRALDLGAGHGGDAVWLAGRGWVVTAVDVARTALDRVETLARAVGVSERVRTERHDLARSFPEGRFGLVTAAFFQTPLELDRGAVLRRAAAALEQGGVLLVVDHAAPPSWAPEEHHDREFSSAAVTLATIRLDEDTWSVERCERVTRYATGPNGERGELEDNLIAIRRTA